MQTYGIFNVVRKWLNIYIGGNTKHTRYCHLKFTIDSMAQIVIVSFVEISQIRHKYK